MSEIIIALLLIVPVALIIAILSYLHKKQNQKKQDKLSAYLNKVTGAPALKPRYQKHLIHQFVLIDESLRKIVIINHHEGDLSHELISLDSIRSSKVLHLKETVKADQNKRTEVITTQIGVEIIFEHPAKEFFLVVYDHIEHTIFQREDMVKEAQELQETISKLNSPQLEGV